MDIEWNNTKREATLQERGLDFADLSNFDWDSAIYFDDDRLDYNEKRQVAFGFLNDRLLVVVFTIRDESYRIISMRRANKRERKVYDSF